MLTTRPLGRSSLDVCEIGFGAWAIGGVRYGDVSRKQALGALEAYVDQGGTFVDTARSYRHSEDLIGTFIQTHGGRDELVLASKSGETRPDDVRRDLEISLQNLQTDYLDIYYIHEPPENYDQMQEILGVFSELKDEGLIRSVGASIKGPDVNQDTVVLSRRYIRSGKVDVLQVVYSIFRQKNEEMFAEAESSDVGIVARTVLESGFLTGKYKPGHEFSDGDHRTRWNGYHLSRILDEVEQLQDRMVTPPYSSIGEVAIRFAMDHPQVNSVLVGAKSVDQVSENLRVTELPSLDPALRQSLVDRYNNRESRYNTNMELIPA